MLLKDFSGAITDDVRDERSDVLQMVTNFNALLRKRGMVPYRDSEAIADGAGGPNDLRAFQIALGPSSAYKLFALGHETSQVYARIFYKNLVTSGTENLADGGWTETAKNIDSADAIERNFFVYYKKRARIFFGKAGKIGSYDPTGAQNINDEAHNLAHTTIAQGIVHSKDDIMYVPYDNKIATNNDNAWTDAALTLPTHYVITSICEYGDFLAIMCAHVDGVSNSRVYLWDRDSSLTTISASIDWGSGSGAIVEEVDGILIGVSTASGSIPGFNTNGQVRFAPRVIFRYLSGTQAIKIREYLGEATTLYLPISKQKQDNRLYFNMSIKLWGAQRDGVWSFGRVPGGEYTLVHERTPQNDTAVTSYIPYGFLFVGDFLFQSYNNNGTNTLSKTNDQASYTAMSIAETVKWNAGDASCKKALKGVAVMFESLPSGAQVTLYYRQDEATAWTKMFVETTANSISYAAVGIDGTDATNPGVKISDWKEIQFRAESVGGAVPTAIYAVAEMTEKRAF